MEVKPPFSDPGLVPQQDHASIFIVLVLPGGRYLTPLYADNSPLFTEVRNLCFKPTIVSGMKGVAIFLITVWCWTGKYLYTVVTVKKKTSLSELFFLSTVPLPVELNLPLRGFGLWLAL